eukprot:m.498590 g.498590  ORF g.498590 m.498590 type:complete len:127 (-) comp54677_c0_seq1:204-584(-)
MWTNEAMEAAATSLINKCESWYTKYCPYWPAVQLTYHAIKAISHWFIGRISGQQACKEVLDAAGGVAGGTAGGAGGRWAAAMVGAALGITVGPIGICVGSIVGAATGAWIAKQATGTMFDLHSKQL